MTLDATAKMLLPGQTVNDATARIRNIRLLRRQRRAPIDKLAERDRLVRYWKAAYLQWRPDLCRIKPNFARVHVRSFRPGMLHGRLSLLLGHVPAFLKWKFRKQAKVEMPNQPAKTAEAHAQLNLFDA